MGREIAFLVLVSVLLSLQTVCAITGSIGNARAIVDVDLEDESYELSRTVRVNNVNDEPIDIHLDPARDLIGRVEFLDNDFTLEPNEFKDARFVVTIEQPGTYDGGVNVIFGPKGGGPGVILTATLIINAKGEGELFNSTFEEEEEPKTEEINKEETTEEEKITEETSNEDTSEEGDVSVSLGKDVKSEGKKDATILNGILITAGIVIFGSLIFLILFYRGRER